MSPNVESFDLNDTNNAIMSTPALQDTSLMIQRQVCLLVQLPFSFALCLVLLFDHQTRNSLEWNEFI